MKEKNISNKAIMKTHCDLIISQMNEMKAYLDLDDNSLNIQSNVFRELSSISICEDSLAELKLYLESMRAN